MALMGSLSSGASAVRSMGKAMTVVGSNIANVNTYGFKSNRVSFEDLLAADFSQGAINTSLSQGVSIANIDADFSQGTFEQTAIDTDMAINGQGFFTVKNQEGREFYTRVGQFNFDEDGYLATDRGHRVLARSINPLTREPIDEPHPIQILGQVEPPRKTGDGKDASGIVVKANLDSSSAIRENFFDPTNVNDSMINFTTSVTVHDEVGDAHSAVIAFRKRPDTPDQVGPNGQVIPGAKNQWEWYVLFDGSEIGSEPGVLKAVGGGFLQFDNDGRLVQALGGNFSQQGGGIDPTTGQPLPAGPVVLQPAPVDPVSGKPQVTVNFGGTPQVIGVDFGLGSNPQDPTDERTGLDGVTQFASSSRVVRASADGHPSGTLDNISVDSDGTLIGLFDGGFSRDLGQLMLTRFDNPQKLTKAGENLFEGSLEAGNKDIGRPGFRGFGEIRSQTLEQSNVDLASEFVKMMEIQRGFQANTRTITTSDEMIQDLVNIKR